jgi:hypothetical protein
VGLKKRLCQVQIFVFKPSNFLNNQKSHSNRGVSSNKTENSKINTTLPIATSNRLENLFRQAQKTSQKTLKKANVTLKAHNNNKQKLTKQIRILRHSICLHLSQLNRNS